MFSIPIHRRLQLVAMLACLALAGDANAVLWTCGADAVANTASVLCGSGTCTAALVRVTTAIEVRSGGCEFDLGGRALSLERNFQMTGLGFIRVVNAGNITLTSTGKLNARGDFVQPDGSIVQGGLVSLTSAGVISIDGQIDVTGDSAGTVRLAGAGNVTLEPGSSVTGRGVSSFPDLGMLFTDGGELTMVSDAGNVTINGDVVLSGANQGTGGILDLTAARTVTINRSVDVSGGGGDGGELAIIAGDDVVINNGTINADSSVGAGFGGAIDITSGVDEIGGVVPGGDTLVTSASLVLRGSTTDQFAGDGGDIDVLALGDIRFTGSGMAIRVDAGTNFDGSGGRVSLDSGDAGFFTLGADEGDIQVAGLVSMNGGNAGGDGGTFEASAGRDLTITAAITASGYDAGGEISGDAGRTIVLNGLLTADASSATGDGGFMSFEAGVATDAANAGSLSVQKNLDVSGGSGSSTRQSISLAACGLSVSPSVKIDGTAGTLNGVNGGASIDLISKRAMQIGNNSQYLALPGGTNTTIHPSGANPVIGNGTVFNPTRLDSIVASGPYPGCAVCGDNVRQPGEICDKGAGADGACCNTTCSQLLCATATPTPQRTATRTATPTATATATASRTATPTATAIATASPTATPVATTTATASPTATPVATTTATTTATASPTATPVATTTATTTATASPTATPVATTTATTTATASPTATPVATTTATATATASPTATPVATTTATTTATASPTATPVATTTATATATASPTATPVATTTATVSALPSPTVTPTATATITTTATPTASPSTTATPTASASATPTPTPTPSPSVSPTRSATPTATASTTPRITTTPTPVATASALRSSTPTTAATPSAMTTPSPLPTVADCAGVPDADGDGLRNQCDDVDADIFLRRARIRGSKPTTGEILAKGEVELGPEAPFDPLLGLDIQLVDTLHLDRRFTFAATECSALRSGRIVCKAPGGRATARFQPLRAKPGRIRFDLRFQGLTLTEPFAPALLVRITTDPASAPAGVDRVGSLSSCRVTAKALLCVAPR